MGVGGVGKDTVVAEGDAAGDVTSRGATTPGGESARPRGSQAVGSARPAESVGQRGPPCSWWVGGRAGKAREPVRALRPLAGAASAHSHRHLHFLRENLGASLGVNSCASLVPIQKQEQSVPAVDYPPPGFPERKHRGKRGKSQQTRHTT
ncbi:hypothetical protein K439DRAFT_1624034 [Ramaria rubella]|nr:hypothetical protein K439DRAFT_1624034 [Ramaria rubella]